MKQYYDQDGITLYLGDCREILPSLPKVDLVVVSPPYNLSKKWWDCGVNGIHKELARKFSEDWYDDELPEHEYQYRQRYLIDLAVANCKGSVCYNHKVRYAFKREGRAFHPSEWLPLEHLWIEIIWDKGGGPALNCRRPVVSDERIFVLGRPSVWHDLGYTSIWKLNPDKDAPGHPCAFPVELPSRLISMFTNPSDTVMDYFLGSGTTAVACKKLGRKCIGIEIEERYLEIAVKRLSQTVMYLPSREEQITQDSQSELFDSKGENHDQ